MTNETRLMSKDENKKIKTELNKKVFKILSCDDESHIKEFLWNLLSEEGHVVDFAKDGEEVFKRLGKTKYDLVILDVNMPKMNGYKVSAKICKNIQNRPKILIFTGRNLEQEKLQFIYSDADAILQKGSPINSIIETVHKLLEKNSPATPKSKPRSIPTSTFLSASTDIKPTREQSEPTREQSEPTREQSEPAREQSEPAREQSESAREQSEPAREQSEPAREQSEPTREQFESTQEQINFINSNYDQNLNYCLSRVSKLEKTTKRKMEIYEEFIRHTLLDRQHIQRIEANLKNQKANLKKTHGIIYFLILVLFAIVIAAFF